jgi:16S rRNA (uracil1498-N3)-methyltransferase
MKIASIFLKKKLDKNTDHFLDNSQIHYLKKVLKLKEGEELLIFDGNGNKHISTYNGKDATRIKELVTKPATFDTSVLIPFLKKSQFEFMLQKCVEIGVKNITVYLSRKSKSTFSFHKEINKIDRYEEIIKSAFLQSENFYLPKLEIIQSVDSFDFSGFSSICVLDQSARNRISSDKKYDLLISGGEFGFDEQEREIFNKNQATYMNLGENILRAETAPLVALSKINI